MVGGLMFREKNKDGTTKLTGGLAKPITLNDVWPVGAIYMSATSTSPATLFGGTWVATGQGRVLVGLNPADTDFDVPLEIGGEKTHTLTEAEIPSHDHGAGNLEVNRKAGTGSSTGVAQGNATAATNVPVQGTTGSRGGGGAHNNLQPYQVVYMWRRTA